MGQRRKEVKWRPTKGQSCRRHERWCKSPPASSPPEARELRYLYLHTSWSLLNAVHAHVNSQALPALCKRQQSQFWLPEGSPLAKRCKCWLLEERKHAWELMCLKWKKGSKETWGKYWQHLQGGAFLSLNGTYNGVGESDQQLHNSKGVDTQRVLKTTEGIALMSASACREGLREDFQSKWRKRRN